MSTNDHASAVWAPPGHVVSDRMENLYPGIRSAVTRFVAWCAAQDIDTESILSDREYEMTVGDDITSGDALEFHELSSVLAGWLETCDGEPGEFDLVSAYLSHCDALPASRPTRVAYRVGPDDTVLAIFGDHPAVRPEHVPGATVHPDGSLDYDERDPDVFADALRRGTAVDATDAARATRALEMSGWRPVVFDPWRRPVRVMRDADAGERIRAGAPFFNRSGIFRGLMIGPAPGDTVYTTGGDIGGIGVASTVRSTDRRGRAGIGPFGTVGLTGLQRDALAANMRDAARSGGAVYLILSYADVIGWRTLPPTGELGPVVLASPDRRSVTTRAHMAVVADALETGDAS